MLWIALPSSPDQASLPDNPLNGWLSHACPSLVRQPMRHRGRASSGLHGVGSAAAAHQQLPPGAFEPGLYLLSEYETRERAIRPMNDVA